MYCDDDKLTQEEVDEMIDKNTGVCQYKDFDGEDLSGIDFSGIHFENVRFVDTILTDAIFTGATFGERVRFWDTIFEDAVDLDIIQIEGIGSRRGTTIYIPSSDSVCCGCFEGTLEEFEEAVQRKHKYSPQYHKEYSDAIAQFKAIREERKSNEG
ncbi:pentapeptide repeat-containing protein [Listeria booriae]|uniref:pentapeptide repeat-containing protein n=1 Tax=Listeria booriae TaxID=1552123 RepID=UPI0016242080|nr:pentapeptide repeat-containing protein [Listeria booriae]MBC2207444.1 pentapeptide repeat-containing protein [Listeria booriae]